MSKRSSLLRLQRSRSRSSMYTAPVIEFEKTETESFDDALKRSKILTLSTSEWVGATVLYYIKTQRRRGSKSSSASSSADGTSTKKTDRYLALIQKKDPLTQANTIIYLAQVVVRPGGSVEIKHPFELAGLKAIDNVDDRDPHDDPEESAHELVFVFPQIDAVLYFESDGARAEATFVIVKVCRHVYHTDISYDYKLDMESLGYGFVTSGQLRKFPSLSRVGVGSTVGDMFVEEELEAEKVLADLQKGSSSAQDVSYLSADELLAALAVQEEHLQGEIIDFLLKWEDEGGDDDDEEAPEEAQSRTPRSVKSTKSAPRTRSRRQSMAMRETLDVLAAISGVDKDLEQVDQWLGDQIKDLHSVQARLFLIESESSSIESSYSNLCNVQRIIDSIISHLQVTAEEEALLRQPMQTIKNILSGKALTDVEERLEDLVHAMKNVQNALLMKGFENEDEGITESEWHSLKGMKNIDLQRSKLLEISDICCGTIAREADTLFSLIMNHKSLHKKDKGKQTSVDVPSFDFRSMLLANYGNMNASRNYSVGEDLEKNQALCAQKIFHSTLAEFLPTLETVLEFSKYQSSQTQAVQAKHKKRNVLSNDNTMWNQTILNSYCKVHEKLMYGPLIKQLFADISNLIGSRHSVISLRSCKKFIPWKAPNANGDQGQHKNVLENAVLADKDCLYYSLARKTLNSQHPSITPWEALEMALVALAPVVTREESFFQSIFNCDTTEMGSDRKFDGEVVVQGQEHENSMEPLAPQHRSGKALWSLLFNQMRAVSTFSAARGDKSNYLLPKAEVQLNILFAALPVCVGKLVNFTEANIIENALDDFINVASTSLTFGLTSGLGLESSVNETDGLEAIAMLVTLQNYMIRMGIPHDPPKYRLAGDASDELNAPSLSLDGAIDFSATGNPTGDAGAAIPGSMAAWQEEDGEEEEEEENGDKDEDKNHYSRYLASLLYRVRSVLISKIKLSLRENIAWLQSQKADPKNAGVLSPMAKLPSFIISILNITSQLLDGASIMCIDEFIFVITREVLEWTMMISDLNTKYKDVVLMHNLTFFEEVIGSFMKDKSSWQGKTGVISTLHHLQPFLVYASEERLAAEKRYIRWMISYVFGPLSNIYSRIEDLGERVKLEELALYVRRKDVIAVVNDLTSKTIESGINNMDYRMKKHIISSDGEEIVIQGHTLCQKTWIALRDRMLHMLVRLGDATLASYQINLLVTPEEVSKMFNRNVH